MEPAEDYVEGVCREATARRGEIAASAAIDTLYFGGGTPSLLPLSWIGRIADACGSRRYKEWTVEVNPDDVTPEYASGLRGLGVNRVSMGVQSLSDDMLRWMRRRHSADGARQAFRALRAAGFDNISVDIMFGINGMSLATLQDTVREILEWRPEHISAYQLSIDDGSALRELNKVGEYIELDEDDCLEQYKFICSALAAAGYEHYEISNWALPGRRALHNNTYWDRFPYVGLGPGAHSMNSESERSWNSKDLKDWKTGGEVLTEWEIWEEKVMLGLRTSDGIPEELLSERPPEDEDDYTPGEYIPDPSKYISRLVPASKPGHLRIPESDWFVADDIISGIVGDSWIYGTLD